MKFKYYVMWEREQTTYSKPFFVAAEACEYAEDLFCKYEDITRITIRKKED